MPTRITCPRCQHEQVVEDSAGADVLCEVCLRVIERATTAIQPGPGPVKHAPPVLADEPRAPRRRRDHSEPSAAVPMLILLGAGGLALLLLVCGFGGVGWLFLRQSARREEPVIRRDVEPVEPVVPVVPDRPAPRVVDNRPAPRAEDRPAPPVEAAPADDAEERVRNGDFEQGNRGFRSDYRLSHDNVRPELSYDLVADPRHAHAEAASFGDHTSGKGRMMVVNGGVAPGLVVWGQIVAVRPGADYTFRLWVASWTPFSPADLDVRINGTSVGRAQAPAAVGQWQELRVAWKAGADGTAAIEILGLNPAFSGNDFALDDISLRGPAPAK